MEQPHPTGEHLTDYERAVCYYTLPRTVSSINTGLVFAYVLCLIEAFAALCYGLVSGNETWTAAGAWCLGGIVVFGIVVFTIRALLSEVRVRKNLALASRMPEAQTTNNGLPDPFAGHILLRVPSNPSANPYPCTDNQGAPRYTVERRPPGAWLRVLTPDGAEYLLVQAKKRAGSFSMVEDRAPSRMEVYKGAEQVGEVRRHFNLKASVMAVTYRGPAPRNYVVRDEGIYRDGRLVGRLYRVRHHFYLDILEQDLCEPILALFAAQA